VTRAYRADGERSYCRHLIQPQLSNRREPPPPQPRARTDRYEHRHVTAQETQRGQVEVIVMKVRYQHRVGPVDQAPVQRRCAAAQMRDAPAQKRIGEQTHPLQLDQDAGVAQENDTVRWRACTTSHSRAIGHSFRT
jgi:hypothetical protein